MECFFDATVDLITVEVGPLPARLKVHKAILCSSSEYLKARCKPEWSRTNNTIRIPGNHSIPTLNIYVNWLYLRKLPSTIMTRGKKVVPGRVFLQLAEAFVLGEVLIDTEFKDSVMDHFCDCISIVDEDDFWATAGELLNVIHEGTPKKSAARKIMVEAYKHDLDELENISETAPREFLVEFILARCEDDGGPVKTLSSMRVAEGCKYHSHKETAGCYLRK